jgi:small membrane protein
MVAAMMIQIFLSALLGGIALMVGVQRETSRVMRVLVLAVIGLGCVFVWAPQETNVIAEALGVGRGADLVLYLWVVITLGLILVLYLKVLRMSRRLTQLTRAMALADVRYPDADQHGH